MSTTPTLPLDRAGLAALAEAIAIRGITGADDDIRRLVTRLRCDGFHGVALDVLDDETQPAVARERAFGIVHRLALAAAPAAPAVRLAAA